MSSQQTEAVTALRALVDTGLELSFAMIEFDLTKHPEVGDKLAAFRDVLAEARDLPIAPTATPPEGAPAVDGGDAVEVRTAAAIYVFTSQAEAAQFKAAYLDPPEAVRFAYAALCEELAAYEEPIAHVAQAVKALEAEFPGITGASLATPPTEAREPVGDEELLEDVAEALAHYSLQQKHDLNDRVGHELTEKLRGRFRAYRAAQPQATPREHPAAQGDAGTVREVDVLRIPAQPGLDPIICYFDDVRAGVGRLTVACYGDAWTCCWSAMGNRSVREFVAGTDHSYLSGALLQLCGGNGRHREYTARIAKAVIAALTDPQGEHKENES